jgi:hypothetical protein
MCFLLPTVPFFLILESFKAIIIAQWTQTSPDNIKSQNQLSMMAKLLVRPYISGLGISGLSVAIL